MTKGLKVFIWVVIGLILVAVAVVVVLKIPETKEWLEKQVDKVPVSVEKITENVANAKNLIIR